MQNHAKTDPLIDLSSSSEMFRKIAVVKFLRKKIRGDYSYLGIQFATWNVTEDRLHYRYFATFFFQITHNSYPTHGTTAIWLPRGQLWVIMEGAASLTRC